MQALKTRQKHYDYRLEAWPEIGQCEPSGQLFGKVGEFFSVSPDWEAQVSGLLASLTHDVAQAWHRTAPMQTILNETLLLKQRVTALEEAASVIVPITSLVPFDYELVKPVMAVVKQEHGSYVATFFDANLSASGDTDVEAIINLKDTLVSSLEILLEHSETRLGPAMLRQKATLLEFVRHK